MIRAVIDTSVLVSALIGRPDSSPALVVKSCRDGRVGFVASPQLLAELADVLERPKFARWTRGDRSAAYLAGLAAMAELHADVQNPPPATPDPHDDYLIALALIAHADVLISVDRHLLDAASTGVTVITPARLLERLS